MKRSDIHCPSKIVPSDYEYVAITYFGGQGININDVPFVIEERKRLKDHMTRTGGHYSGHEHGGTCHCCGAHAIYTVAFYHKKSNSYIKVGQICAEKLEMSFDGNEANLFRKRVREALKIAKGKKKAKEVLNELGFSQAWSIFEANKLDNPYEETVIVNMVHSLVRYGRLSDKQTDYLKILLTKINGRAEEERKRKEEYNNAADCPVGRLKFKGIVLSIKQQSGFYGTELKMLVKSENGFKAWGTVPRSLFDIERGSEIEMEASFTQSKKDTKFGFFKRPTKAKCIGKIGLTDLEEILEDKFA